MKKESETKNIVDIRNKVSSKELENVLKTNMKAIMDNPEMSEQLPPLFVFGSPGVGKSSIVRSVAEELGIQFIDWRTTQLDAIDTRGLPVPDKDKKQVEWFTPSELPTDENATGILMMDELPAADRSVQCSLYQIILDRKIGTFYSLPKRFMVVAAGNKTTDKAIASTIPSALANRFMHLELDANAEDWVEWAQYHDIHPAVVGFITYKNEYLFHMEGEILDRGWPSPRSWERVSHILKLYKNLNSEDPILRKLVYGLVGNRAGVEFMEFYRINAKFDNVLEYMLDPSKKITIPERADERYALVSSMNYLLWRGKDEDDQNRRIDGFFRINMELPADFAAMSMMSALNGTNKNERGKYASILLNHSKYAEWSKKYGKSLRKRCVI